LTPTLTLLTLTLALALPGRRRRSALLGLSGRQRADADERCSDDADRAKSGFHRALLLLGLRNPNALDVPFAAQIVGPAGGDLFIIVSSFFASEVAT